MPRRYRCHPLLKLPPTSRRVLHAYAQMQGWHVIPMGTFLGAQRMDAYQPDRWPRMSLTDGCAWTRQLDMLGPPNFFCMFSIHVSLYGNNCITPKDPTTCSCLFHMERGTLKSWSLNSKPSLQGKLLHLRDLSWPYITI